MLASKIIIKLIHVIVSFQYLQESQLDGQPFPMPQKLAWLSLGQLPVCLHISKTPSWIISLSTESHPAIFGQSGKNTSLTHLTRLAWILKVKFLFKFIFYEFPCSLTYSSWCTNIFVPSNFGILLVQGSIFGALTGAQ